MHLKGALFALLAFAIFSTHDVVVKFLGGSYSPIQIIFFTVLFSFPMLMLVIIRESEGGSLIPVHPWWTGARTASGTLSAACTFYAFTVLPLTQVYPILFAMPLLVTILSIPFLGERVGWHRAGAVLIGLAGVIVVLRPGSADLSLGHAAALAGAVFSAISSVIMRKIGRAERTVVIQVYPLLVNFAVMGAALPFVYTPPSVEHLGASAVVALLALLAMTSLVAAYRLAPAIIVAPMQYSQIIWASIYGAIFFGEHLDRMTMIGTGIIIASGLYIVLREDRRKGSSNQPVLRSRSRLGTPGSPRIASFLRGERDE